MMTEIYAAPVLVNDRNAPHFRSLLLEIYTESGHDPALVNDELIAGYVERISHRRLVVIGAALRGQLIGYGAMEMRNVGKENHAFVLLSILSAHWGKGVGRMLMENLIRIARHSRESSLHLEVAEGNARARRLYERLGFRYRSEFSLYPPHSVPHALMRLTLEPSPS